MVAPSTALFVRRLRIMQLDFILFYFLFVTVSAISDNVQITANCAVKECSQFSSQVIFSKDEYSIYSNNGSLKTIYSNELWNYSTYEICGKNVSLCFPLSKEFLQCKPEYTRKTDVVLQGAKLFWIAENLTFNPGDYEMKINSAGLCLLRVKTKPENQRKIFVIAWALSIAALTIAFVVYIVLPIRFHNHVLILQCHKICFIVRDIISLNLLYYRSSKNLCIISGVINEFLVLSGYVWLCTLTFDLWRKFRVPCYGSKSCRTMGTFGKQSLFALGIPFLVVALFLLLDIFFGPSGPNFEEACWMLHDNSYFVYKFIPSGMILLLTATFYFLTCMGLRRIKHESVRANELMHRQLMQLVFKLLVITFVFHSLWIINALLETKFGFPFAFYSTVIVCLIRLQGVFFFLVYVCRPSILEALWRQMSSRSPEVVSHPAVPLHRVLSQKPALQLKGKL